MRTGATGDASRGAAQGSLARLWKVLVVHSVKDLVRYKSFLLLVAVLIVADRVFQYYVRPQEMAIRFPPLSELGPVWAAWVFEEAPRVFAELATNWHIAGALIALFAVKELVSLWPSSDMRLMHRKERGRMGFVGALGVLRFGQVVWDATASAILVVLGLVWFLIAFLPARALWTATGWAGWLGVFAGWVALAAPAILSGLSYSSKLAIISRGRFGEKLGLFLRLFTEWKLFWQSWVFCVLRIAVEGVFALIVPLIVFATVDNFWLRIGIAAVFAAPAYSYVKMASFKFFLEMYKPYPLVYEEFRDYYVTYDL